MTLDDLLKRYFAIVGDVADNPREFLRSRAIDLVNEGNRQFRRVVEDEWYRQDIGAVGGTAIYNFPGVNVRALRIAFEDETMRPRTVQEIVALDDRWERRERSRPFEWTTQGVAHDEFRAYPEPSVTTVAAINQTAAESGAGAPNDPGPVPSGGESGTITSWDESGTFATFSSEFGVITRISDFVNQFQGEFGHVQTIAQSVTPGFTIWGVKKTEVLVESEEDVPVKNAYQKVGLWYALWHTYEEEGDHHNAVLAGFYKARFNDEVNRARDRASSPLPWIVFKLGQRMNHRSSRAFLPFSPEAGDGMGGTQQIGWPKRGYWS